jgi:arginine exporter protein ArgO
MKTIKGFATLIGTAFLIIMGLRALNSGAITRTKDATKFDHDAAVEAVKRTVKPFEDNLQDLTPRRKDAEQ